MFLFLFLLFRGGDAAGLENAITLFDLISPQSIQRQFDTLSAAVSDEYSQKVISFDASTLPKFEDRPINLTHLNRKYRDHLYQGDMVLPPATLNKIIESTVNRKKRKAFVNHEYPATIWKTGVPYAFHSSLNTVALASIQKAIDFWQLETCIDFFPRKDQDQYLEFIGNDDGCWSTVGKDSELGKQVVSIGSGCEHFGVTSHELAHALGVFHEQSRYDRDSHVNLNINVLDRSLLYNFAKVSPKEMSLYNLPYDVGSVMHYTPTEFSQIKGVPVLTTVDPNLQQTMGQMEGPSFLDVAILNHHYKCQERCSTEVSCQNGGIVDSRNCSKCKCPSGFGGDRCETVAASFSKGCGGVLKVEEAVRRFEITIKQSEKGSKEKQCHYHLVAPPGKKILVNLLRMKGRCVEGCWLDGVEFKMTADYRPIGYRFCCTLNSQRRLLSKTNAVPLIISSRSSTVNMVFEYTHVDANAKFDSEPNIQSELEVLESRDDQMEGISTTIKETKL